MPRRRTPAGSPLRMTLSSLASNARTHSPAAHATRSSSGVNARPRARWYASRKHSLSSIDDELCSSVRVKTADAAPASCCLRAGRSAVPVMHDERPAVLPANVLRFPVDVTYNDGAANAVEDRACSFANLIQPAGFRMRIEVPHAIVTERPYAGAIGAPMPPTAVADSGASPTRHVRASIRPVARATRRIYSVTRHPARAELLRPRIPQQLPCDLRMVQAPRAASGRDIRIPRGDAAPRRTHRSFGRSAVLSERLRAHRQAGDQ